ncbi:MAG TPA: tetratricopeptide repeat protein [Woeseiaceae bacterium]|nr:tetratricopeptide repeat protein [Woeseiaceae bacterium]
MTRIVLVLVLAAGVSACAQLPGAPATPESRDVPSTPDSGGAAASPTAALLEQGRQQSAAGDYARAAASVERALRIEPANPYLWLELANIHRAAGNAPQAEANARKALSLAGSDRAAEQAARQFLDGSATR